MLQEDEILTPSEKEATFRAYKKRTGRDGEPMGAVSGRYVDERTETEYEPLVRRTTRSIPRSSSLIIAARWPTVFEMGFRVNRHCSSRDGNGIVIRGSPL